MMKKIILMLLTLSPMMSQADPTPFPLFLKVGFSSVLEFGAVPTRVVIGDIQSFQVEKLDRSLVVRPLVPNTVSNMFVYFKTNEPRFFVLTASEDAEPTYFKKFDETVTPSKTKNLSPAKKPATFKSGVRILRSSFDAKKDYLTVEVEISADSMQSIKPKWDLVRLSDEKSMIKPEKVWAQRKVVQKDSRVLARFIFRRPDLSRRLENIKLIIPVVGLASLNAILTRKI